MSNHVKQLEELSIATWRPEETLQGVQYLWRTSHHDEFNMELQPEEVQMSSGLEVAGGLGG